MASFSDEIDNCPSPLSLLKISQIQRNRLMPAKAARQKECEKCSVSFPF